MTTEPTQPTELSAQTPGGKPTPRMQEFVGHLRPSLPLTTQRSPMAWIAVILILLSACSSAPTGSPRPSASSDPCAVGGQAPPRGNIPATFATALAFAPDGRLFWAERSGKVKVWQDGAARTFAQVQTVTTERDGSYSERGLLGLAISPTFSLDRFVYAFYSDVNYTQEHIIRWRDCRGTGTDPTILLTLPSGVLATWHIRSRKDGLGLPDHSYPWARNSIEGQGKPVLLTV
jgi:glucose/sorbosone dehydrogenase